VLLHFYHRYCTVLCAGICYSCVPVPVTATLAEHRSVLQVCAAARYCALHCIEPHPVTFSAVPVGLLRIQLLCFRTAVLHLQASDACRPMLPVSVRKLSAEIDCSRHAYIVLYFIMGCTFSTGGVCGFTPVCDVLLVEVLASHGWGCATAHAGPAQVYYCSLIVTNVLYLHFE
jgi:hypothetical protein